MLLQEETVQITETDPQEGIVTEIGVTMAEAVKSAVVAVVSLVLTSVIETTRTASLSATSLMTVKAVI